MSFDIEFRDHLFQKKNDFHFISSPSAEERFDIYKKTLQENLKNSLKLTYPGTCQLLGEEFFKTLTHAYCLQYEYWPRTGNLDEFGEQFSSFLNLIKQLSAYPYLPDFARYEWVKQKSYLQADTQALNPESFAKINLDCCESLSFQIRPTTYLMQSNYNLSVIEQILKNNHEELKDEKKDDIVKKSFALITRLDQRRASFWIEEAVFVFIQELSAEKNLLQARQCAEKINSDFDLTQALVFILQSKIFREL